MTNDMNDVFEELQGMADNPAKLWAPREVPEGKDEDECITDRLVYGIVEEFEIRTGDYGSFPWLILRRQDGSRVSVHGFGEVLGNRLKNTRIGDGLVLEYLGTAHSRERDADYANYRVERRPAAPGLAIVPDDDEEGGDKDAASG